MTSKNLAPKTSNKVDTRFSLVNNLLQYPSQVANILQENEEIIDYDLVQLLENISEYMTKQNRTSTANFLINVTEQIQHYLNYQCSMSQAEAKISVT
ncbi:MAG: hypothetical protein QNJ55_18790 [Xenococcus sp. MO_188.B8]|nr:hypothetical protein [Xenococcus sp. MO_188.B8]